VACILDAMDAAARNALANPKVREVPRGAYFNARSFRAWYGDRFVRVKAEKLGPVFREGNVRLE